MTPEMWTLFGQFGPLGLFIAYLVWRETRSDEKRGTIEKERAESDRALASALTALTVTIQHMDRNSR